MPVRVYIDPSSAPGTPGLGECVALTVVHEIGHSIGIFDHSPNASDLMFVDPSVSGPSARDLATAEVLYHVPANVEAVRP